MYKALVAELQPRSLDFVDGHLKVALALGFLQATHNRTYIKLTTLQLTKFEEAILGARPTQKQAIVLNIQTLDSCLCRTYVEKRILLVVLDIEALDTHPREEVDVDAVQSHLRTEILRCKLRGTLHGEVLNTLDI